MLITVDRQQDDRRPNNQTDYQTNRWRLSFFRRSVYAVVDQALLSATNFFTMVLIARVLGPSAFGTFILAFTALLFVRSLQASLITQPHNVLGATINDQDYVRYTTSTALGQILFSSVSTMVTLVGAVACVRLAPDAAPLLFALSPAILAWQFQEFVRRVLYTEGRLGAALSKDVISYGGQLMTIIALWHTNTLTGPTAFYAVAATSGVGAIVGFWQLSRSISFPTTLDAVHENWAFGKC